MKNLTDTPAESPPGVTFIVFDEIHLCTQSDVLPWPPCASHSWLRYSPTSVTCDNCEYSAYIPSPIAGWEEFIDDDLIPNPPRPQLPKRKGI
jgi:hypothetical protein